MQRLVFALELPLSRPVLPAGSPLHQLQLRLQPLARRLAAVGPRRWQQLLLLFAALWLLLSLARIVWLLMPWPASMPSTAVPVNAALAGGAAATPARAVDIEAMVAWKLFGDAGAIEAQPLVVAAVDEAAQESALNLRLQGVMSAEEQAQARALILAEGKQQQFSVGDKLPAAGQVVLRRVMPDRVIIDNNGRAETIWLYDPALTRTSPQQRAQQTPARTVDLRGDAEVTSAAAGYRERLFSDPASLSDVLQVSVERDGGRMVGYRVRPGRDAEQFERFGFRPGDVVIAINGVGLEDPQRALELYNQMRSATDATFTVRRGDEELTLVVALASQ